MSEDFGARLAVVEKDVARLLAIHDGNGRDSLSVRIALLEDEIRESRGVMGWKMKTVATGSGLGALAVLYEIWQAIQPFLQ